MSILDSLRDRFRREPEDVFYEDEYYNDQDYPAEQDTHRRRRKDSLSNRLLGTPPRPEAESVSVYTRSGRPVDVNPPIPADTYANRGYAQGMYNQGSSDARSYDQTSYAPTTAAVSAVGYATQLGGQTRLAQSSLPAYVLRPSTYDDIETVIRRAKTNQPVVLILKNTPIETAKRILDFSFGLALGLNGEVQEIDDRVFAVLPQGLALTQTDLDKLISDGDISR